jgi:putative FmdB family regulatory protein
VPTYDYECRACNDVQEINLPINYEEEIRCGHCGNVLSIFGESNPLQGKWLGGKELDCQDWDCEDYCWCDSLEE